MLGGGRRCGAGGGCGRSSWGCDPGDAVAHLDLPCLLVDFGVVPAADESQVVQVGRAAAGPPVTWWASQASPGTVQPGMTQPPSRASRAVFWAGVARRWVRPRSSRAPFGASSGGPDGGVAGEQFQGGRVDVAGVFHPGRYPVGRQGTPQPRQVVRRSVSAAVTVPGRVFVRRPGGFSGWRWRYARVVYRILRRVSPSILPVLWIVLAEALLRRLFGRSSVGSSLAASAFREAVAQPAGEVVIEGDRQAVGAVGPGGGDVFDARDQDHLDRRVGRAPAPRVRAAPRSRPRPAAARPRLVRGSSGLLARRRVGDGRRGCVIAGLAGGGAGARRRPRRSAARVRCRSAVFVSGVGWAG